MRHIRGWWEFRDVEHTAVVGACAVAHTLLWKGRAIPAVLQTLAEIYITQTLRCLFVLGWKEPKGTPLKYSF